MARALANWKHGHGYSGGLMEESSSRLLPQTISGNLINTSAHACSEIGQKWF
jgi:hypothetical protein